MMPQKRNKNVYRSVSMKCYHQNRGHSGQASDQPQAFSKPGVSPIFSTVKDGSPSKSGTLRPSVRPTPKLSPPQACPRFSARSRMDGHQKSGTLRPSVRPTPSSLQTTPGPDLPPNPTLLPRP